MTTTAITALRTERDLLVSILDDLDDATWAAPSGCEGWSVKDLVAHLAANWASILDPGETPPPVEGEPFTEPGVAVRRENRPDQVLAEYRDRSEPAIEALAGLQEPPMADNEVPIATLGSYPLHLIANALAFDHYCHLRHDLLAPRGPLSISVDPGEDALAATVDWLLAGIPQMCKDTFNPAVDAPFVVDLTGPGGGTWTVQPGGPHGVEVVEGAVSDPAFTVSSSTDAFVSWSTKRADWRTTAQVSDAAAAAPVLDALDLE